MVRNKIFLSLCFSLTGLYFVVTGVQYWIPDYLQNEIGVSAHTTSLYFSVTSLSAPISGVIVGGIVVSKCGGYNTRKSHKLLLVVAVFAVLSALPVPFIKRGQFYFIGTCCWLLLFFGGFVLPPLTGIMINSVGDYEKSSANSIANICYNLFGYLPAPALYGLVASFSNSRWALGMLMYSTIFTVGLLYYGITTKLRQDWEQDHESMKMTKGKQSQHSKGLNDFEDMEQGLLEDTDRRKESGLQTSSPTQISSDEHAAFGINNRESVENRESSELSHPKELVL